LRQGGKKVPDLGKEKRKTTQKRRCKKENWESKTPLLVARKGKASGSEKKQRGEGVVDLERRPEGKKGRKNLSVKSWTHDANLS